MKTDCYIRMLHHEITKPKVNIIKMLVDLKYELKWENENIILQPTDLESVGLKS